MTGRAQRKASGYRKCLDLELAGGEVGVFYTPICRICERTSTDYWRPKRFYGMFTTPKKNNNKNDVFQLGPWSLRSLWTIQRGQQHPRGPRGGPDWSQGSLVNDIF